MFKITRLGKTLAAWGVVAAMALAGMQSAGATIVTQWNFDNTDGWISFTPVPGVNGSVNNALGDPTVLDWGTAFPGPGPNSSLVLGSNNGNPGNHTGTVFTAYDSFMGIGAISSTITHNNNVITGDFLDTFILQGTIKLTAVSPIPPAPGDPFPPSGVNVPFTGYFFESTNAAPCGFSTTSICDDIFVLQNPTALVLPFTFAGQNYEAFLHDVGGALGPLSAAACAAAGAPSGCFGWQTVEGGNNVLNMELNIRAVPEPGSLALLALGLVGVVVILRRKSRRFV